MGENYLHEQAENAQKRRDRARLDLARPKLFDRPDIIKVIYNVVPSNNEQLSNDEKLLVLAPKNRQEIDLLRDNIQVGTIQGEGVKTLHDELSKPENGGAVYIQISNVSKLSGCADGQLIQE